MAFVDVTFSRDGTLFTTTARIAEGWNDANGRFHFYGQEYLDFRHDIKLRVAVWLEPVGPAKNIPASFPPEAIGSIGEDQLKAALEKGRLVVKMQLCANLPWIRTTNGKPAVDWNAGPIAHYSSVQFHLRFLSVFNFPRGRVGDTREWDVLPFLPGGRIESNRRRH